MSIFHGLACRHLAFATAARLQKKRNMMCFFILCDLLCYAMVCIVALLPLSSSSPLIIVLNSPPQSSPPMFLPDMLSEALAPPFHRGVAVPELLLPRVRGVRAFAAHVGRIFLAALVSAPALADTLFDCPLPFLCPNRPPHRRRLRRDCGLRNLILGCTLVTQNPLGVVDELVCKTAKKLKALSSCCPHGRPVGKKGRHRCRQCPGR